MQYDIAIITPDESIQRKIGEYLEASEITSRSYKNADEALVNTFRVIDLIESGLTFMDHEMKGSKGPQAALMMRNLGYKGRIVAIIENEEQMREFGKDADFFMYKDEISDGKLSSVIKGIYD